MAQQITRKTKTERPREVLHDETPSGITDHAFEPKGFWWSLCTHCGLAESAHAETTVRRPHFHYVGDDEED